MNSISFEELNSLLSLKRTCNLSKIEIDTLNDVGRKVIRGKKISKKLYKEAWRIFAYSCILKKGK